VSKKDGPRAKVRALPAPYPDIIPVMQTKKPRPGENGENCLRASPFERATLLGYTFASLGTDCEAVTSQN
jgi:hypothetical protein